MAKHVSRITLALSLLAASIAAQAAPPAPSAPIVPVTPTVRPTWSFDGHDRPVRVAVFSPDGKFLATSSDDKQTILWDVAAGKELFRLPGAVSDLMAMAFSTDGKTLVGLAQADQIYVWDTATGKLSSTLAINKQQAGALLLSPDMKRIITVGVTVQAWEFPGGKHLWTTKLQTNNGPQTAAISPDGTRIAIPAYGLGVAVLDAATGNDVGTIPQVENFSTTCVAFSGDSKRLVVGARALRLYDAAKATPLTAAPTQKEIDAAWSVGSPQMVRFSADGKNLFWSNGSNIVWADPSTGKTMTIVNAEFGTRSLAVSPDAKWGVFTNGGRKLKIVPLVPGRAANVSTMGGTPVSAKGTVKEPSGVLTIEGHEGNIIGLAVSPDGSRIFTTAGDRTVRAWDVATGKQLWQADAGSSTATGLFLYDGGKTLVTGYTALTFDAASGKPGIKLETLNGHSMAGAKNILAVASQGKDEKSIAIFEPGAAKPARLLPTAARQQHLAISADASTLAWSAYQQKPHVLGVDGSDRGEFDATEVEGVALSPDGSQLALGTTRDLLLFDVANKKMLYKVPHFVARHIVFSADGKQILLSTGGVSPAVLRNAATGEAIGVGRDPSDFATLAFLPNSKGIVATHMDRIRIYPPNTLEPPPKPKK